MVRINFDAEDDEERERAKGKAIPDGLLLSRKRSHF